MRYVVLLIACALSCVSRGMCVGMYAPSEGMYLGLTSSETLTSAIDKTPAVLMAFYELRELKTSLSNIHVFLLRCKQWDILPIVSLTTFDGLSSYTTDDIVWFSTFLNDCDMSILLRWNHEMNGNWFLWGQKPVEYVEKYIEWYNISKKLAPTVGMVWSPDISSGYPFQGKFQNGTADFTAADTNKDGVVDSKDDGYGPYFPGEQYVEWIGLTNYHWGLELIDGNYGIGYNVAPYNGEFQYSMESIFTWADSRNLSLPLVLCETGALYDTNSTFTDQAGLVSATEEEIKLPWMDQVYNKTALQTIYKRLKAVVWFNMAKNEDAVRGDMVDWSLSNNKVVYTHYKNLVKDLFFIDTFPQPPVYGDIGGRGVIFSIVVAFLAALAIIVLSPILSPTIKRLIRGSTRVLEEDVSPEPRRKSVISVADAHKVFRDFVQGKNVYSGTWFSRVLHVTLLLLGFAIFGYSLFVRFTVPGGMPTRVTYVVTPCEIGIVILMTFYNFLMMENPWYVSLFNGSQVKAQPDNLEFKDELEAKEELCMIDVLVVCYKEDQSTLINTFRACSKMLKPKTVHQVNVYLLDDLGTDERVDLCAKYGANYLTRAHTEHCGEHGKAGNLNFGLSQCKSEFVLILDADMAPEPYCLSVLHEALMRAGPHTAFIQSAHRFYDLPAGDVFYSRSLLFNTKTLSYFGSYGCCPFVGSNALFRRASLDAVGGIDVTSITEDILTSFRMHELGWRSFYVPVNVAFGTSPQTGPQMLTQRARWALGGLEFAIQHWRGLLKLNWMTRSLFAFIIFNSILCPLVITTLYGALCTSLVLKLPIYSDNVGKYTLLYILALRVAWMCGLITRTQSSTLELWSEEVVGPYYLMPVTVLMWFVDGAYVNTWIRRPETIRTFKSTVAQQHVQLEHMIIMKVIGCMAAVLCFSGGLGLAFYVYRNFYGGLLVSILCLTTGLRTFMSCYWYTVPHTRQLYPLVDASMDCLKNIRFAVMTVLPATDFLGAVAICVYIWLVQNNISTLIA